jgi:uncharacterized membrane-anchored protein YjiN (DUF445 family)
MLSPKEGIMGVQNSKKVDVKNEKLGYSAKKLSSVVSKKTKDAKYNLRANTIIIAGSARLPENTTAKHVFGHLTIELEIDHSDSTIVDFSCTLSPSLGEKMLRNALLRSKIEEGIRDAVKQLEERFSGATKKAMIAALEDAYKQYKKFLKK